MSETHMQIFDEKWHLLQLKWDNEVLLKIEEEDKWWIWELLSLSQDDENESGLENWLPEDRRPNWAESFEIEKSKS